MKLFLFFLLVVPALLSAQRTSTTTMQVKPLPALPPKDPGLVAFLGGFQELKGLPSGFSDWFYWTNYSRTRPRAFWDSVVVPLMQTYPHLNTSYAASLKKDLYAVQGLKLVKPNVLLMKSAQAHAFDLARNSPGSLSHNSTNGASFEQRIAKTGIQKCAAENLSLGPFNPVLSLVLLYLDEGLRDLGHRKNLLNPYYLEMGIGIASGRGSSSVAVQDFACDQ